MAADTATEPREQRQSGRVSSLIEAVWTASALAATLGQATLGQPVSPIDDPAGEVLGAAGLAERTPGGWALTPGAAAEIGDRASSVAAALRSTLGQAAAIAAAIPSAARDAEDATRHGGWSRRAGLHVRPGDANRPRHRPGHPRPGPGAGQAERRGEGAHGPGGTPPAGRARPPRRGHRGRRPYRPAVHRPVGARRGPGPALSGAQARRQVDAVRPHGSWRRGCDRPLAGQERRRQRRDRAAVCRPAGGRRIRAAVPAPAPAWCAGRPNQPATVTR
jgi:hypothetical protein